MIPCQLLLSTLILFCQAFDNAPCHALLSPLRIHGVHHRQQNQIKAPQFSPRKPSRLFAALSSTVQVERHNDISTFNDDEGINNNTSGDQLVKELGPAFTQKLSELEDYRRKNGHCLVPKRYECNPSLGNWVNKQRQNYRKFLKGEKSSMNEQRLSALNEIGFVWNASSAPRSTYNDIAWQKMYNQLSQFHANNGNCQVASGSPLGRWVVRQRFLYRQYPNAKNQSSLTDERISLLNDLDFPWMTRSEQLWERRISELREFKEKYGHVRVTKSSREYPANPQLSAWVATQRKNYNRKQQGKPSPLTLERINQLEEMGFIWSYWDYNFMSNERFD